MKLTKFGHSCVLVEDGPTRILVDPGTFSAGWEGLTGLRAVLITHQHPDHLDLVRLTGLLEQQAGNVQVFADPGSVTVLGNAGIAATAAAAGDILDLGVRVQVFGSDHAVIHRDLPGIPNRGYWIGDRVYLPGDSLEVPPVAVQILGVPVSAPWMAAKEAVEFVRAIEPAIAFPIHEKVLAATGTVYGLLEKLKPAGTEWLNLDDGRTVDL